MSTLIGLAAGAAISAGTAAIQGGSAKDILKSAGIGAATGAVTGGAGSMLGSSAAGLLGKGVSAVGDKLASSSSSLLSKAGSSLATAGDKMVAFGATHGVKATLSNLKTELGKKALENTVTNAPANVGGPASVTETASLPEVSGVPEPTTNALPEVPKVTTTGGMQNIATNIKDIGKTAADTAKNTGKAPINNMTTKGITLSTKDNVIANIKKVGGKVGKVAGQVGVQGVLSVGTAIAGAKQARAANEVSRQGLLFQQQTYKEQKAERESTKAQLKQDAYTAHTSATVFTENLFGENSNGNLLTDYTSDSKSNYSLLKSSIKTKKSSDLT